MRFFVFIWRNLFRRPVRSGLTIIALSVAVAAVVALVGISDSFSRQFQKLYDRREIDLVVQKVGSSEELNNDLPEEMGDRIKQIPHVTAAMGGLMDTVSFEDQGVPLVIINGWRPDSPLFHDRERKLLPGSRLPTANDHGKVIIGSELAKALDKKIGDKITIYSKEVEIIGIFETDTVFEKESIATLLSDMQQNMDRPRRVTGFIIQTDLKDAPDRKAQIAAIGKQVEKLGEGIAAIPSTEFIESVGPIKLSKAASWAISAIALVIGAIGVLNTMVMSIYERVREIGTLRAIGWRKFRVVWMILCESVVLSLAGGIIGSLAALALTRFLSKMPMTSGLIEGDIAPVVFVEGLLLALLVGFTGALYPAYWGANLSPNEAMRRK